MNERNEKPKSTKGVFGFIDLITSRIGKITALIAATGGLILGVQQFYHKVVPEPNVMVEDLILPDKVKISEWDDMSIKLKGHNCDGTTGLYVMFYNKLAYARLKSPYDVDGQADCRGRSQYPWCWGGKKPVCKGKGDWEWDLYPPQLELVGDPRDIKRFPIHWEVRDYEDQTKVIRADIKTIELLNDSDREP